MILFRDPFVVALPRTHPLAKETTIECERLWCEDLLLLRDGHCLRDHALSACRHADRRRTEGFEATSLPTLVQMVDNGLGTTLLPTLAVDAGVLLGTNLFTRPLLAHDPTREIGLVWRQGTGRRDEFRLLANELSERAKAIGRCAGNEINRHVKAGTMHGRCTAGFQSPCDDKRPRWGSPGSNPARRD